MELSVVTSNPLITSLILIPHRKKLWLSVDVIKRLPSLDDDQ